jgi:hypothetical protein
MDPKAKRTWLIVGLGGRHLGRGSTRLCGNLLAPRGPLTGRRCPPFMPAQAHRGDGGPLGVKVQPWTGRES